jgi:hypothetical protein
VTLPVCDAAHTQGELTRLIPVAILCAMTPLAQQKTTAAAGVRWGAILSGAVLLELVLFIVLVPIGLAFGMPGAGNGTDFRVFFVAVPLGCLLFGYLFGRWTGRRVASQHALHGVLVGVVAFAIYLAVCSIPPNTIAAVIAGYGAPRFWLFNSLRLVGCIGGAVTVRSR